MGAEEFKAKMNKYDVESDIEAVSDLGFGDEPQQQSFVNLGGNDSELDFEDQEFINGGGLVDSPGLDNYGKPLNESTQKGNEEFLKQIAVEDSPFAPRFNLNNSSSSGDSMNNSIDGVIQPEIPKSIIATEQVPN
jgi:hypothetical protein